MIHCLGEALVDLICERPVCSLAEVDAFAPHFGGALANVAVAAAAPGPESDSPGPRATMRGGAGFESGSSPKGWT